ncbi:HET-domain-containing protein [Rhizodiscina lignyota]|uniref:HET-domain-containing protein n=1 Tax=Rhizodiscina lignyota TaxID=1504668 RepID=A0A9P4IH35_9PEZI|nr:HET-domain-containing protein [Rhizodiscina lignyota]
MAGTTVRDFRYTDVPLPHPNALRLLRLHPAESKESGIECELFTVPPSERKLGEQEHGPWQLQESYEALSWTWGDVGEMVPIRIICKQNPTWEAFKFDIKPNLAAALKALRYENIPRVLWVDAISINQKDYDEKNHQVPMMSDVYGNCLRVCVWLGEGVEVTGGPKIAMDFIKNEVLDIWGFDRLCENLSIPEKWRALIGLMNVPWFSRRWVVQEIALAKEGLLYCGDEKITWKQFSDAVSLFVEVETATHRLSEVMKKDVRTNHIPDFFGHVPALGATILVENLNNLFRRSVDKFEEPLLTLEHLVSTLTVFQAGRPHDTIYALLSIASDATPRAASLRVKDFSVSARRELSAWGENIASKTFYVDYEQPYPELCREFVEFSIHQTEPNRALDILCHPWAPPISSERPPPPMEGHTGAGRRQWNIHLEELPSWIPSLKDAAFTMWDRKMARANADPLVGLPMTGHRNYSAAGTRPVNLKQLKFKTRKKHCSIYVEGFVLDEVDQVQEVARKGNIPENWFALGGWLNTKKDPPEEFWRTIVAGRGPHGRNAPAFYPTACREAIAKGLHGGTVEAKTLIHEMQCSIVAEFMRRVEAVITNRRLMRTAAGRLGLGREDTEPGHLICILYGCTVPVILQKVKKSDEQLQMEREEDQQAEREEAAITIQRSYLATRERRAQRRRLQQERLQRDRENAENLKEERLELKRSLLQFRNPRQALSAAQHHFADQLANEYAHIRLELWLNLKSFTKRFLYWKNIYQYYAAIAVPMFFITYWMLAGTLPSEDGRLEVLLVAGATLAILAMIRLVVTFGSSLAKARIRRPQLRNNDDERYYYKVIGECYVHGMMDNEAIKFQNQHQEDDGGKYKAKVFELR